MDWVKFTDPRPEFGFAFACGRRSFGWLFEKYPQDALQTLSLALTAEPTVGRQLANKVVSELGHLARALGYFKPAVAGRRVWVSAAAQLPDNYDTTGKRMVFRGAPPCGTPKCYSNGCRTEECQAGARLRGQKYYRRSRTALST